MATRSILFIFIFIFLISPIISTHSIESWCDQTPNPQPCNHFLSKNPKYNFPIKHKSSFIKLQSQLALDHVIQAYNKIKSLDLNPRDEREKAALADCVRLYGDTVREVNKSTDPACSPTRAQRLTSAALTNLETCKLGFHDFGIKYHGFPLMPKNVTLLLKNVLALNKDASNREKTSYKRGFPSWVGVDSRRWLRKKYNQDQGNVVVAQDGSGDFTTVSEAVDAAEKWSGSGSCVIKVKEGTYEENVNIGSGLNNIMLLGEGIGRTIITGSKNVVDGDSTFNSATFAVDGDGFIARGITFRNTAGSDKQQAVAFRSASDRSVLYQCSFEGYHDTLYVYSKRQFYRDCDIYGTVDFIFGNAAAVIQNSNIYLRKPTEGTITITAQGRDDPADDTGISIQSCRVVPTSELRPVQGSVKAFLGRPWKMYSRTVYIKTYLDDVIDPAGWMPWAGTFALDTLYYGEYENTGPGSDTSNRVDWKGYRVITSASEADQFAPNSFIAADSWIPEANVPFTSGL